MYKPIAPLIKESLIAPIGAIFIYKISLKKTGEYYIGQTESPKRRLYRHYTTIINTITENEKRPFPFHKAFANRIKNGREFVSKTTARKEVIDAIEFTILAIKENKNDANSFEYQYIRLCNNDKCCLNRRMS